MIGATARAAGEGVAAGRTRRRPRRLSAVFQRLADDAGERVTVADMLDALGDRSFAAQLVLVRRIQSSAAASRIVGDPGRAVADRGGATFMGKSARLAARLHRPQISAFGPVPIDHEPPRAEASAIGTGGATPLLAVLAPPRRPGHRWDRAAARDHRHTPDPARQLAAGFRHSASRTCPFRT